MMNILMQEDIKLVEDRLKKFETNTGCELLLVVANESDPYPAAALRFGVVSAFLLSLVFSYYLEFHEGWLWPVSFFILTLIMSWIGHFTWAKKLALSDWETERECGEKAIELFHTMGTSKVTHKVTAMVMLSLLEKKIEVLVDEKLKSQITQAELDELVTIMQRDFKQGNMCLGLLNSIESLEQKVLKDFGGKVSNVNPSELSDRILFI